jgi:DNA polymerase-3 subunit chi
MKSVVYFIELKNSSAKNKYICDITEKLYDSNKKVCIYSPDDFNQIDNLLWTWKQESFIPHEVGYQSITGDDPVVICNKPENLINNGVLILQKPLSPNILNTYSLIFDFAEVYNSEKKEESRQRFKEFRDSGKFDVQFMQLGALLAQKTYL